ncbi:MAG: HD domain-containing protein [Synechococcaceae cyanobacterium]|nr:HD domain-containing protein [Synechococcaceae cyanobacterium]
MAHSDRYDRALAWAAQLHRGQFRKGKAVPYISHLISVSALVWEDGGSEDQAIAGLLHDAIEDSGQDHGSICERFGSAVADIVVACTDTSGPSTADAPKEPWLLRKTRTIDSLTRKPASSWLVIAADKAHNARDLMIDAGRDPRSWDRFAPGLDGSCWYLWSLHRQLQQLLTHSRSVEMLGSCVEAILAMPEVRQRLEQGQSAQEWVAAYLQRPHTHPQET